MQTLTFCGTKIMSTRTAAGQFKGQFKGALEELSGKVRKASTHSLSSKIHKHTHSNHTSVQGGDG
jgi:hypothetical protein